MSTEGARAAGASHNQSVVNMACHHASGRGNAGWATHQRPPPGCADAPQMLLLPPPLLLHSNSR